MDKEKVYIEGLTVRQINNEGLTMIIHPEKLMEAIKELKRNDSGCIRLEIDKLTFPNQKKGYTHTKPFIKVAIE